MSPAGRITQAPSTFVAQLLAVIDDVVDLNCRPETSVVDLVDAAVASGELALADRAIVIDTIRALLSGLSQVCTLSPAMQAGAVEGCKRLLSGTLLRTTPT